MTNPINKQPTITINGKHSSNVSMSHLLNVVVVDSSQFLLHAELASV